MANQIHMLYGESGTGKSEAAKALAKYLAERFGWMARILVGDGSKTTYKSLLDDGIAQSLDFTTRSYPLSTMQLLTEGHWPEHTDDPESPLLPPTPESMADIGLYLFEGLSVGSNYIMGDNVGGLSWRSGQGEKIGQDSPIRVGDGTYDRLGNFKPAFEGAQQYGANPPSHYNMAQRRMLTYVDRSKVLPVEMVIWTAHQRAVEDKISREVIIGPEVAGSALTANLQRIFNHTLHFTVAQKRVQTKDVHTNKSVDDLDLDYRIYTRDHFSPDGNVTYKFKAVTRGVPAGNGWDKQRTKVDGMPKYLTGKPGEAIMEFFEIVKQYQKQSDGGTKAKFEEARARRRAAA